MTTVKIEITRLVEVDIHDDGEIGTHGSIRTLYHSIGVRLTESERDEAWQKYSDEVSRGIADHPNK